MLQWAANCSSSAICRWKADDSNSNPRRTMRASELVMWAPDQALTELLRRLLSAPSTDRIYGGNRVFTRQLKLGLSLFRGKDTVNARPLCPEM